MWNLNFHITIHTISFVTKTERALIEPRIDLKSRSFYPVFTPSGLPGTRVGSTPMKPPRWGLNLSPLLIVNLLHFRLRRFSQPQDRFLLRKKFDKSHNGTCEAKALTKLHPCTSVSKAACNQGVLMGIEVLDAVNLPCLIAITNRKQIGSVSDLLMPR